MRFHVSRTGSCPGERDDRPCDEAEWLPYICTDIRLFPTPQAYDAAMAGTHPGFFGGTWEWPKWAEVGENHRAHPRGIARDMPGESWFVELAGLDALMGFVAKHGKVIVKPSTELNGGIPEVVIHEGNWD